MKELIISAEGKDQEIQSLQPTYHQVSINWSFKEPRAAIFTLQVDNDQLKKEVTEAKKREEKLKNELEEGRFTAGLVDL